jgi:hypothetical protein
MKLEKMNVVEKVKNTQYELYYKSERTGIELVRTHEGYNHFACWQVKYKGKVKKSGLKGKEDAVAEGEGLFWEMVGSRIIEKMKYVRSGKAV